MHTKNLIFIFAFVYLMALVIPALFLHSCTPEQFAADNASQSDTTLISVKVPPPLDPCNDDPTKFSVQLHIDDDQNVEWLGLWEECFNLGCQTSWEPALGFICFRCTYPICEDGFKWKSVDHICDVPASYTFIVDVNYEGQGTFWEACILFDPDECLAETTPNTYNFIIYASNCPH